MTDLVERELPLSIQNRSGTHCSWDPSGQLYTMQSLYVPSFRSTGVRPTEALQAYMASSQEADNWRRVGCDFIPTHAEEILDEDYTKTPMSLRIDLCWIFEKAYEAPRNDDLIGRIYAYSYWCDYQIQLEDTSADKHLVTSVVICFYEKIPSCEAAKLEMPTWFTLQEIEDWRDFWARAGHDVAALKALFG